MKKILFILLLILLLIPSICTAYPSITRAPVVNISIPSINGNGEMPITICGDVDYWGIRLSYNDCVKVTNVKGSWLVKYGDNYVEMVGFGNSTLYVTLEGMGYSPLNLYFKGYLKGSTVYSVVKGGIYQSGITGGNFIKRAARHNITV